ncbi:photosystem I reaction center subunit PsaK [Iningainema tapete]|uniref:Photosystem I reaction center subunit PsaK n=1 Tax=Iningainema tapete BLCC-T55 TaxID=2748662 RepID=A0A8J6Y2X6_9CYAN|nr:photosystem I reaction center subunit PsaK [Iningainema tapete]MBD2778573.1 photosystem I reaction center subunit PsaK [Iningainema tapete BLCC-T55]
MISSILFAVQSTVPNSAVELNATGTAIIIVASVLSLLIIPRVVRYPHVGPKMPLPFPAIFNDPSVGTFLAALSTGHIIGIGAVLGLTNLGAI